MSKKTDNLRWVRSLFQTSSPDERDIKGVYDGVMEMVEEIEKLKKEQKRLDEALLKNIKENAKLKLKLKKGGE